MKFIFSLCFLPGVWATEMSHTVKQPIRAELNLEPHCETANQSRAQPWASLWNSQSEQSSTLSLTVKQPIRAELNLISPLYYKVITDHFILGTNPRVLNGHVKPFLEMFCPYLSHLPSMYISKNNLNIVSMHSMALLKYLFTLISCCLPSQTLQTVFAQKLMYVFNINLCVFDSLSAIGHKRASHGMWQLLSVCLLRICALRKPYIRHLNKYGLKCMISARSKPNMFIDRVSELLAVKAQ